MEHKKRRRRLMAMMPDDSIAVIPGGQAQRRNRDIVFPFRQDSDFFYLTGFEEPQALLVLVPGRSQGEEILFCAERDERAEQWDGELMGLERAVPALGVDYAFPFPDIDDILPGLLEGRERIFINLGEYPDFDGRLLAWVAQIRKREAGGAQPPGEFIALRHLLHELRLFKSASEINTLRKAADITAAAHIAAMQVCRPGLEERDLEAELQYVFMREGARFPAYPSIVGSGENACVMHYTRNGAKLKKQDLVLIDAGCEYQYYAADITRTFPVGGRYSAAQRDIYDLVLQANVDAIAACYPGNHFNAPHEAAMRTIVRGLLDLGLVAGEFEALLDSAEVRVLCPHKTSHWLGIDVHDVGDYRIDGCWRDFEPGMVLTIEPGIYIPRNASTAHLPEKYRGIGVRIEDDVLITADGAEVLSAAVPKDADAIETLMAQSATGLL